MKPEAMREAFKKWLDANDLTAHSAARKAGISPGAIVRFSGGGDRPLIRTIRRGTKAGLFTLQAFNGALLEDVEVLAAHRVVSFSQPSG